MAKKLKTGQDLALDALSQATSGRLAAGDDSKTTVAGDDIDEVAASDKLAETLNNLQNVIEGNANQLSTVADKLKEKRQMLRDMLDSDAQLSEAEDQYKKMLDQVKLHKARIQASPESTALRTAIADLNQHKKEVEETLSNHLVNYYQLTHSTSFDTSDGDQWEFVIKAKVKPRRK